MRKPDRRLERSIEGVVCGVDEVGYSPIAGPVVAAAVVLPPGPRPRRLKGLQDSKRLTADRRVQLAAIIRDLAYVGVGSASVYEIDRKNIYQANLLAMARAVSQLERQLKNPLDVALVDGRAKPPLSCRVVTVVRGDEQCLSIAAASIIAKVWRDDLMQRLAAKHPGYGWNTNVGYGTEEHYLGLLRRGPTVHHRRSFAPLATWLTAEQQIPELVFTPFEGPLEPDQLQICWLRRDLYAIADGHRRHLGVLKKGASWRLRAIGYTSDYSSDHGGTAEHQYGGGPLSPWHGKTLAEPSVECLRSVIAD